MLQTMHKDLLIHLMVFDVIINSGCFLDRCAEPLIKNTPNIASHTLQNFVFPSIDIDKSSLLFLSQLSRHEKIDGSTTSTGIQG